MKILFAQILVFALTTMVFLILTVLNVAAIWIGCVGFLIGGLYTVIIDIFEKEGNDE